MSQNKGDNCRRGGDNLLPNTPDYYFSKISAVKDLEDDCDDIADRAADGVVFDGGGSGLGGLGKFIKTFLQNGLIKK